jgi:plasmid stabilization system protein ParE
MKILWTEFAEWNLKDIYLYHKKVANENTALKIK